MGKLKASKFLIKKEQRGPIGRKLCYIQHRLFCDEYQTYAALFGGNITVDTAVAFMLLH